MGMAVVLPRGTRCLAYTLYKPWRIACTRRLLPENTTGV
jgi:hypothetical protein